MQNVVRLASVHQANTLLSINVFAHLQTQAQLLSLEDSRALVWHVVDHDDCRDRRFRQARLPALNGSPRPQTISLTMPSGLTMGAVQLTPQMRVLMIDQLRGYVEANITRLSDLAAWFGRPHTPRSLRKSVSVLSDLISTSVAISVVDLNIEIATFFARAWLKRDVTTISSTTLYATKQQQTAEMLLRLPSEMGDRAMQMGDARSPRWDWWLVKQDGSRAKSPGEPKEWWWGELAGQTMRFRRGVDPLGEAADGEIVVPGILADTVADTVLRQIDVATQYWRSASTLSLASNITKYFWGRTTRSCLVGQPGIFALPTATPPPWLSAAELDGFRSGIYSTALYWTIGYEADPPPLGPAK